MKAKELQIDLAPTDVMGNTPLHICAQKGNKDMCEQILELLPAMENRISTKQADTSVLPKMLTMKNYN